MRTFTLDTNCIIDVAEDRPAAVSVKRLLQAAQDGQADLALVASSASERQEGGGFLKNFAVFEERRNALGFGGLRLLPSIGRYKVSFFGRSLFSSAEMMAREQLIFTTLFPASPPKWKDYAASMGLSRDDYDSREYKKWRNRMLDAQAFWAHDYAQREVFVTGDRNFLRLEGREAFPRALIREPAQALSMI